MYSGTENPYCWFGYLQFYELPRRHPLHTFRVDPDFPCALLLLGGSHSP